MIFNCKKPQHGDMRVRKCFALFPVRLVDRAVMWLETYYKCEYYVDTYGIHEWWVSHITMSEYEAILWKDKK